MLASTGEAQSHPVRPVVTEVCPRLSRRQVQDTLAGSFMRSGATLFQEGKGSEAKLRAALLLAATSATIPYLTYSNCT